MGKAFGLELRSLEDALGPVPYAGCNTFGPSVLILLGGAPRLDRLADVGLLLPLLAAAFRDERAALTAAGQADVAREAAA